MVYDSDVFRAQIGILDRFACHLVHHRELQRFKIPQTINVQFWIDTSDAHILQAAICWCTVFGTHGDTNKIHWKKLRPNSTDDFEAEFRTGLLKRLDKTRFEWDVYCKRMRDFRDNFAAHRTPKGFTDPVPNFDLALNAASYFDEWVREIISPDILEGPTLTQVIELARAGTCRELERVRLYPPPNPDLPADG